jgi:protein-tyrosine phosphatase
MSDTKLNVLMVCLGNICRSPTAEAVFRARVEEAGLGHVIGIDSAGTGSWHIGNPPDKRSSQAAAARHYGMSTLRARQVTRSDLDDFDYIMAMDRQNLQDLRSLGRPEQQDKISLFLDYGHTGHDEVPDPYYSGADGFELVLDLIEDASTSLLQVLIERHGLK